MRSPPFALAVPLFEDQAGVFRVGKSRVLLETLIHAFQKGETPEGIVQSFDTLVLADVYAVVGFYLANPAPIEEYLRQAEHRAELLREKMDRLDTQKESLAVLIQSRAKARGLVCDQTPQ